MKQTEHDEMKRIFQDTGQDQPDGLGTMTGPRFVSLRLVCTKERERDECTTPNTKNLPVACSATTDIEALFDESRPLNHLQMMDF